MRLKSNPGFLILINKRIVGRDFTIEKTTVGLETPLKVTKEKHSVR